MPVKLRSTGCASTPVSQLVDEPVLGLLGGDTKGLVERTVRRTDTQSGVEHDQRLPDGVKHILCEVLDVRNEWLSLTHPWTSRIDN